MFSAQVCPWKDLPLTASGLDTSISDPTLQDLLTRLRELPEFILIITRDPSLADVPSWPFLSIIIHCNQLCLDISDLLGSIPECRLS